MVKNNYFVNGEFHNWYKINFGYSDQAVSNLLDKFQVSEKSRILDPFCGTGTTIIECKKRGIEAFGIDANPSSVFAAEVKTNWNVSPLVLEKNLEKVIRSIVYPRSNNKPINDFTYDYLTHSGMLERGWISIKPLLKALSIKSSIKSLPTAPQYQNILMLALISEIVYNSANIKFGPELYCGPRKDDSNVAEGFKSRVELMIEDLMKAQKLAITKSTIIQDDARQLKGLKRYSYNSKFDFIITSPPYPTEHDYTRNSRLELAFLEKVLDLHSLRKIKREMIRSHTKGVYKEDNDSKFVNRFAIIKELESKINTVAKHKTHGFARLYSTVMKEYFGGMRRHFRSVYPHLKKGAYCAYVVGDQSSYLQVPIQTSKILSHIAESEGFTESETLHFRDRRATKTGKFIGENILILRKK
jgi:tRNA1(Val) A37 N6-methylase TrmN6